MSQYVTFEYKDGSRYCGESENNALHGHGLLVEPSNKGLFEGLWVKGSRISGVYTWTQNKQYAGEWKGPFRNGLGVETRQDGTRYSGEYTQNSMGPLGVLSLPTHGLYFGTWDSNGMQEGDGVEAYADGGYYRGQYKNGVRSGYGTRSSTGYEQKLKEAFSQNRSIAKQPSMAYVPSQIPHATLKKNIAEGHSVDNLAEGVAYDQLYEGQWIKDKRCGHGVLKADGCFTYYGEWKENTRTGYGVLIYEKQQQRKGKKEEIIKEEGRWENGKLKEPLKSTTMAIMKSDLRQKVEAAHAQAIEAATQARDRARVAEAKANAATAKSKVADVRAAEARQNAEAACKKVEDAARITKQIVDDAYSIKGGVRIVIEEPPPDMSTKPRSGSLDTSTSYNEMATARIHLMNHGLPQTSSFHSLKDAQVSTKPFSTVEPSTKN